MAKVRRRVRKTKPAQQQQAVEPEVPELTEDEQEQSKRFITMLGVVFVLVVMLFVVLHFTSR